MKQIFICLLLTLFAAGNAFSQDVPSAGPIPFGTQMEKVPPPYTNPNIQFDGPTTAFAFQTFPTPTVWKTFPIPGYTETTVGPGTFTDFASSGIFAPNGTFFMTTAGDVSGTSQLYRINTSTGAATLVANVSGATTTGLNGITYDPTTGIFYVCTGTNIYTIDTTTAVTTSVGPTGITGGLMIDIAIDCAGTMYGVDLGTDNTYTINKATGTATLLGPLGFNLNFGAGMTYDKQNDILYLFGLEGGVNINALRTINTTTGAATTLHTWVPALSQFAPFDLIGNICPGGGGNETLVLLHDSTLGTSGNIGERKADRDTLLSALSMLISDYDVMTFDSTTVFPMLSNYKTIIIQETSFDDLIVRYMGAAGRTQLKAWLNSGTSGNKKALLMIGADNGYNYSRSGSGGRDLELSQNLMKYVYQADNSGSLAPFSITGLDIDNGNARTYTNTTSGFWPDGVSVESGGDELYHYSARGTDDSLAGVGYNATGYVSATLNLDPRYFTGSFKATLEKYIGYLVTNGGVITGVQNVTSNVPDRYNLSQNYPNPFNPTTKISFSIPQAGFVTLKVYDMLGREVQSLVNGQLTAGEYISEFNGANLTSGTYFYRLQVGDFVQTKKMVLVK